MTAARIVVLGAGGRIGGLLARVWAGQPQVIWHARQAPADLVWDMLAAPPPPLDLGETGVVVCLAGVTRGDDAAMQRNVALARAATEAAQVWGARAILHASTIAVYGNAPPPGGWAESAACRPVSAYGAAKLRVESEMPDSAPGFQTVALRIANVLGADALIGGNAGRAGPVVLDPVPGQAAGPLRSYIGPRGLADVLRGLADLAVAGQALPRVLNIATPGAVAMGALLDAAGIDWRFGPDNPQVLPRAVADTAALERLLPGVAGLADAAALIAEWRALAGGRVA